MSYYKQIRQAAVRSFGTALLVIAIASPAVAQAPADSIIRIDLPVGRSHPLAITAGVNKVSVANPEVADVVAVSPQDVVINARATGETDLIIWPNTGGVAHYRIAVHSPADRKQILVSVKFAEVRKSLLYDIGVSALYHRDNVRAGTGDFRNDANIDPVTGKAVIPLETSFLTVLSNFGTKDFLAMMRLEEERGLAHMLAEPNILAGNKEDASFLAGGEIPIPVAQAVGGAGQIGTFVTILYREFGIRLNFNGEIISDSLIKLKVRPEVSNLDYANAVILSGFRIPALRTRRVESTLDLKREQSLIISGLFDDERELVKNGIPLLMDIPILGHLFSSTSWQKNETELVVIVTPMVIDPMQPRPQDIMHFPADTTRPAMEAIQKRWPPLRQP